MAPLPPRSSKSNRVKKSTHKSSSLSSSSPSTSLFAPNKKDKRRIKHAQLLSKITKSQAKKPKRRRPSNKLVTTLETLANALPDNHEAGGDYEDGAQGGTKDHSSDHLQAVIKRKSLKSRPGALKRRQKVDNEEMARFARNMAQLAASTAETDPNADTPAAPAPTQKWAALRNFISLTLDKKVPAPAATS